MRRRICLAIGLVALTVPASGWAQSSSQAQYQGVAPETQIPVSGGGGTTGGGGSAATPTGAGSTATGGGRPVSGVGRGGGGTAAAPPGSSSGSSGAQAPAVSLPSASTSTSPLGGSDILLVVLAIAACTGLGLLLRRTTHRAPAA